jgi:hypothetical protein
LGKLKNINQMTTTTPTEGQIYVRSSSQANLFKKPRGKSPVEKLQEAQEKLVKYRAEYLGMNPTTKSALNKLIQIQKLEASIPELQSKANKPVMSKSALNECVKLYIGHRFNRYESIDNKFTRKGTTSEEQGISIESLHKGVMFVKNETRLYNDEYLVTGEPDIFYPRDINNPDISNAKAIVDIKCSWDIHTWHRSAFDSLKDIYEWQGHDYMLLTGAKSHTVAHILLSTPYKQVLDEIKKETFKYDGDDDLPNWRVVDIMQEMVYEKETLDRYLDAYGIDPLSSPESSAIYHSFVEVPMGAERVFEFTFERDESKFELIKEVNRKAVTFIKEELMTGNWRNGSLSQEEETE